MKVTPSSNLERVQERSTNMLFWNRPEVERSYQGYCDGLGLDNCLAPQDCRVGAWTDWGACSKNCGGGTRTRTRKVLQEMQRKGRECPNLEDSQECNTQPCPIDCVVSNWDPWTTCTKPCNGGVQSRKRHITTEAEYGGVPCPPQSEFLEVRDCNVGPCPVDCVLSEWGDWSNCSANCGDGAQKRHRSPLVQGQNGGRACIQEELMEEEACNEGECPCPVEPEVGSWSEWGECVTDTTGDDGQACGYGEQKRQRSMVQLGDAGVNSEQPQLLQTQGCHLGVCTQDCVVGDWSDWTTCSEECGGGSQTRKRDTYIDPANGGKPCPALTETRSCNDHPCPVDADVGPWSEWGPTPDSSTNEHPSCKRTNYCDGVLTQTRTRPIVKPAKHCGKTPPTSETRSLECKIPGCQDCEYGNTFGPCKQDPYALNYVLGFGSKTQEIQTLPRNGGRPCGAPVKQSCPMQFCLWGYNHGMHGGSLIHAAHCYRCSSPNGGGLCYWHGSYPLGEPYSREYGDCYDCM